jgi:hypothetical protein
MPVSPEPSVLPVPYPESRAHESIPVGIPCRQCGHPF